MQHSIKPSMLPQCQAEVFCGHHKVIQCPLPIRIQPKALLKQSSQGWGCCQTLRKATFPLLCSNSDSVKAEYLLQPALLKHTLQQKPQWFGWLWPFSILVKSIRKISLLVFAIYEVLFCGARVLKKKISSWMVMCAECHSHKYSFC